MIKRVRSDHPSFRSVVFKEDFNVIVADRGRLSTERDSRNGLGKTTLIEIIHFCLGSKPKKGDVLTSKELKNWTFILDISLNGKDFSIHRNTSNPSKVRLEGDFSNWPIKPDFDNNTKTYFMNIKDWRKLLGYLMFDLPLEIYDKKYTPSFRSLISYFARKGVGAFQDPFRHFPQQRSWDIQINNAYLLGLNWEYVAELQLLNDQEKALKELKKATMEGLLNGYIGTLGELESTKVTLESEIQNLEEQLNNFRVHPQYIAIEKEANELTERIHEITNKMIITKKIFNQYQQSLKVEEDVPIETVERVYQEVGLWFPKKLKKRIQEVKKFHEQIVSNRKIYLRSEINKLENEIEYYSDEIKRLSDKRAELFGILETHKALEEYKKLNERLIELKQQLKDIVSRIENLKKFETDLNSLKIRKLELIQKMRQDFEERKAIREKAIKFFNQNSEFLYSEPGVLSIEVTDKGYKFKVEIKRARSQGIGYMKVFCYDLMLIQLRSNKKDKPGFLIHDSTIFDGVDERQIAKAMELAAIEAKERGFQYICTINSDKIPYYEFNEKFKDFFEDSIRIRLKDDSPNGSLLGMRF